MQAYQQPRQHGGQTRFYHHQTVKGGRAQHDNGPKAHLHRAKAKD
jgi:hypothetical protein